MPGIIFTHAASLFVTRPEASFSATSWLGTVTKAAENKPEVGIGVASVASDMVLSNGSEDEEETDKALVAKKDKIDEETRVSGTWTERNEHTDRKTKAIQFLVILRLRRRTQPPSVGRGLTGATGGNRLV